MIRLASEDMIPSCQAIWAACFHDDTAYIEYLFTRLLQPERILVDTDEQGRPTAMLCMEPFVLTGPACEAKGAYIYGVATLPEERGKGRSTVLLAACHEHMRAEGVALTALVPAGESLFRFYGARGYETAFEIAFADYTADEIPPARRAFQLEPVQFGALAGLRDRLFADRACFVRWSPEYLGYIGGECALLGGEVLRIISGDITGYAVCYKSGDQLVVKELALPDECLPDALAALHTRYGLHRYRLYLPADATLPKKVLPFAMVQWYDKVIQERFAAQQGRAAWIAHVLD